MRQKVPKDLIVAMYGSRTNSSGDMTDSSGGHTPLSRMRFSWQRRDELTDDELASPPEPEGAAGQTEQTWPPTEAPAAAEPPQAGPAPTAPPPSADPAGASPAAAGEAAAYAGDPMLAPGPPGGGYALPGPSTSAPHPTVPGSAPDPKPASPPISPGPPPGRDPGGDDEPPRGRSGAKRPKRERSSDGDFEVPRPGGRFSGRRGLHSGVRATLVITCCLVVLGVVGFGAYVYGVAVAGDATYSLSEEDVAAYHLDDFPVGPAGEFAADYVRVCLDHPENEAAQEQRQDQLAQYTTSGVDAT